MDVAAEFKLDPIAQAPRQANAPTRPDDQPSFDDHIARAESAARDSDDAQARDLNQQDARDASNVGEADGAEDKNTHTATRKPATQESSESVEAQACATPPPQPVMAPPTQPWLQVMAQLANGGAQNTPIETPTEMPLAAPDMGDAPISAPALNAAPATNAAPAAPKTEAPAPTPQPAPQAGAVAQARAEAVSGQVQSTSAQPIADIVATPAKSAATKQEATQAPTQDQTAVSPDPIAQPTPDAIVTAPVISTAKSATTTSVETPDSPTQIDADAQKAAPKAEAPTGKSAEPQGDAASKQATPAPSFAAALQAARAANAATSPAPEFGADTSAPQISAASSASSSAQATPLHQASAANATQAAAEHGAARAPHAAAQVGREIIRRFNGENTRFEIRIDPPELGRVDVRLEVSRDHKVTAVIAADSPQALTELTRGARDLEQALQSAGLDLAENGLRFDLSDQRQASSQTERPEHGSGAASADAENIESTPVAARPIGMERWRGVRVDLVA